MYVWSLTHAYVKRLKKLNTYESLDFSSVTKKIHYSINNILSNTIQGLLRYFVYRGGACIRKVVCAIGVPCPAPLKNVGHPSLQV